MYLTRGAMHYCSTLCGTSSKVNFVGENLIEKTKLYILKKYIPNWFF